MHPGSNPVRLRSPGLMSVPLHLLIPMPGTRSKMRTMRPRSSITIRTAILGLLVGALLLAGCASATEEQQPAGGSLLTAYGLDGLNARELIERLDTMLVADRPGDLIASVGPENVQLSDSKGNESVVDLPVDEFYVSVAPYISQTHNCFRHSLTSCLGELGNQEVHVMVTDNSNHEVLVDKTTSTYDNGFIGLWLPRNVEATITVRHDGRAASTVISTSPDAPTCLTTLQLA